VAFVHFIALYGEEKLIACLKENEEKGLVYHYPHKLIGDYDQAESEEEIFALLLQGNRV